MADPPLLDLFREDAQSQLDLLAEGVVEAERAADPADALAVCLRAAHSLKGAARVVGLDAVVALAHAMEEALEAARDGRIRLTVTDADRLLAAVDLVRRLGDVAASDLDGWLAAEGAAFEACGASLMAIGRRRDATPGPDPGSTAGSTPAPGADPPSGSVRSPGSDPSSGSVPSPGADPASGSAGPPASDTPAPSILPATPAPSASAQAEARVADAIKVSPEAIGRLMALSAEVAVELRQLERHVERLGLVGRRLDRLAAARRSRRDAPATPVSSDDQELDALAVSFAGVRADLEQLAAVSRRAADDLHHDVLATRLRPFSDATTGLARQVRDLARRLGKDVRLVVRGADTAVDRDILAALDAPLGHLVRNALDHALESPEERAAVGKALEGRLVIAAAHRGGALVIRIEDDGRGIDADAIRARAVAAGLVEASLAATLSPDEVLAFLFLPGFSTADRLTDISGRGVGLDAVQSMVHAVGGAVRVATVPGEGTTFSLHLPVTRSVLRCLLVSVGGEPLALPLSHVDRLVRAEPGALVTVEGRACVRADGTTIGLVPAAEVLGLPEAPSDRGMVHVVVLADGDRRHGLEVEAFLGERDLVVRPLDGRLGSVPDVLAASLLDDGTPIVILDPDDLVRSIVEGLGAGRLRRGPRVRSTAPEAARRILVVDDSLTVREVERQLLEAQGYVVEVAVDGAAGWNALRLGDHDLLLTDVDMPRMTGMELTRRVRADPRLARLPVIIVSYKDREEDRLAGLEAGADRYLTKASFTDDSLVAAVADLLARGNR